MIPISDENPALLKPIVTWAIIAACIAVFFWQLSFSESGEEELVFALGFVPKNLFDHAVTASLFGISWPWFTLITSMFLHGGWMHLLGNMWFLWIFGDNIEDILGSAKYLLFYLLCGVAAAMAQFLADPESRVAMVGASGAIAGVMGAYMIKFPHSRIVSLVTIIFFFTTIEVPAWLMLIWRFFIQFFSGVGSIGHSQASQGGGIAFLAHVGGFLAGMALIYLLVPRERYTRRRDLYW